MRNMPAGCNCIYTPRCQPPLDANLPWILPRLALSAAFRLSRRLGPHRPLANSFGDRREGAKTSSHSTASAGCPVHKGLRCLTAPPSIAKPGRARHDSEPADELRSLGRTSRLRSQISGPLAPLPDRSYHQRATHIVAGWLDTCDCTADHPLTSSCHPHHGTSKVRRQTIRPRRPTGCAGRTH